MINSNLPFFSQLKRIENLNYPDLEKILDIRVEITYNC